MTRSRRVGRRLLHALTGLQSFLPCLMAGSCPGKPLRNQSWPRTDSLWTLLKFVVELESCRDVPAPAAQQPETFSEVLPVPGSDTVCLDTPCVNSSACIAAGSPALAKAIGHLVAPHDHQDAFPAPFLRLQPPPHFAGIRSAAGHGLQALVRSTCRSLASTGNCNATRPCLSACLLASCPFVSTPQLRKSEAFRYNLARRVRASSMER